MILCIIYLYSNVIKIVNAALKNQISLQYKRMKQGNKKNIFIMRFYLIVRAIWIICFLICKLARHSTHSVRRQLNFTCMYSRSKKMKHLHLFQYKLSYRNETGTNHHGLLSTSIWCFNFFRGASTWEGGLNLTLIFIM